MSSNPVKWNIFKLFFRNDFSKPRKICCDCKSEKCKTFRYDENRLILMWNENREKYLKF